MANLPSASRQRPKSTAGTPRPGEDYTEPEVRHKVGILLREVLLCLNAQLEKHTPVPNPSSDPRWRAPNPSIDRQQIVIQIRRFEEIAKHHGFSVESLISPEERFRFLNPGSVESSQPKEAATELALRVARAEKELLELLPQLELFREAEPGRTEETKPPSPTRIQVHIATNVFRRDHNLWTIAYGDEKVQLPHRIGLEYIAMLLQHPGSLLPTTQLEAMSKCAPAVMPSVNVDSLAGSEAPEEILDATSRREYEQQAQELALKIQEARDRGDHTQAEKLTQDLEMITDQLRADRGLGGKPRKQYPSLEKARQRVTHAIDSAIKSIATQCPTTAAHLGSNIKRGNSMVYLDTHTPWTL